MPESRGRDGDALIGKGSPTTLRLVSSSVTELQQHRSAATPNRPGAMNEAEELAQRVLEAFFTDVRIEFAATQSNGECDFRLFREDNSEIAVEVTRATDPVALRTRAALMDERRGGQVINARRSTGDWLVDPTKDANIRRIRERVDEYLAEIEAAGIGDFFVERDACHPSVARIWKELRIEAGQRIRWKTPGQICIAPPGAGGWVHGSLINDAVERELQKVDNRRKLAARQSAEAHLFVVIESSSDAWGAMFRMMLPDVPPQFPTEIAHAWAVARLPENYALCRVCRVSRAESWEDLGLVAVDAGA
ncbi:MAG: hypothetical protein JWM41_253 [Gemmatimonadetes bacterium]|nr:hypothetical protein [Gemmatimonadota bacterium]